MFARRVLVSALAAVAATSVAWLGLPAPTAHAASASSVNRLADPDTVVAKSGSYVTYGTSTGAQNVGECNTAGAKVPYIVHGSGESPGMSPCISGDAMPGGPGAWAEGAIWAPGVTRFGDRYVMYYTASKAGTGQKCIGRAWSGAATGPFTGQAEWACPGGGRWAIDADPFVANGNLHVAYRDDAVASGAETGLSAVRVNNDTGFADWSTRRTLLRSTNIDWETRGTSGGTHVIENPSMWREPNGTWYVMYSGNNWDSDRYAVGIANCGTSPLPGSTCTPIDQGVNRPYFGYTGSTGINPVKGLPDNHAGPGGMSVFQTPSGEHKVVWHWWTGSNRRVMTGTLNKGTGDAFSVS